MKSLSFCILVKILIVMLPTIGSISLEGGEASRQKYLDMVSRYPRLISTPGDFSKGEIQVVLDPQKMAAIEKKCGRDVGVVMQDNYWIWINDACIFPSGYEGVYGRILWRQSLESSSGVAIMPILPNGKVALNCNFRHATRSWEIELPRGLVNSGEGEAEAAKRETLEETGMVVDKLFLLGEIASDSGLTGTIVPIFAASVLGMQQTQQEESEAIEEILSFSLSEIKEAFVRGHAVCLIRGEQKQVAFRDPFLAYAVLLYELKMRTETPVPICHFIQS